MKKLLSILMLLVAIVTGAWADDTYYYGSMKLENGALKPGASGTIQFVKGGNTLTSSTDLSLSDTPSEGGIYYNSSSLSASDLGTSSNWGTSQGSNRRIRGLKFSNGTNYTLALGTKVATSITFYGWCGSKSKTLTIGGVSYGTPSTKNEFFHNEFTKSGNFTGDVTISQDGDMYGILVIVVSTAPAQTYTVTYKANNGTEESDVVDNAATKAAANTFTAPSGKAFSGWNTSADGTGDAYAVNDAISTDNLVLFAQWVNVYTQFSMTDITGPTEQVASQDKASVTATFSTGGSAEVFNAHSSNPATMVLSKTIFLTSSGNSYCHVSFPSKLQAGDVIALGETTGNAYLATTSTKPNSNSKVTIPYTIPANSSLIGATDLYIFNNKDNGDTEQIGSFSEFTITGAGKASDLAVTSATPININVGGESTIETSSSSTGAITFASSDASVAKVSDTGVITAVGGGTATITINQAADDNYRAGATKVTVTVIETALVKARLTGSTTANMTGSMSATYSGKTQNVDSQVGGCKLGSQENWTGFTLNGDNTLKTGDIVEVKISQRNGSTPFVFYDSKEETNTLLTTTVGPDPGVYRFVLPEAANGKKGVFLVRGKENSEVTGHENTGFNPHVVYIALYRPNAVVTLNSKGFATYSSAYDFEYLGADAYGMELTATSLQGTKVTTGKIAAGEGILFKGEAGATVAITETTGAEALTNNSLIGTTDSDNEIISSSYTYKYALSGDTFKKLTGDLVANKAFFGTNVELSNSLDLVFDGATAINNVNANDNANSAAPVKVIKNGKLYIGNYNVAGARIK